MFSAMTEDSFTQFKYIVYHRRYRSDIQFTIRTLTVHTICKAKFYTGLTQTKEGSSPLQFALLLPLNKAVAVLGTVSSPPCGPGWSSPLPRADPFPETGCVLASPRRKSRPRADSFPEAGCVLASPRLSSSRKRFLFSGERDCLQTNGMPRVEAGAKSTETGNGQRFRLPPRSDRPRSQSQRFISSPQLVLCLERILKRCFPSSNSLLFPFVTVLISNSQFAHSPYIPSARRNFILASRKQKKVHPPFSLHCFYPSIKQ